MTTSSPVTELGRSIADALDPSDIIGRWMAHHIASLITEIEADPTGQDLDHEISETIVKLWEHKAGGRFTTTPMQYVQPVLAAIARLEPDPPPWAHFRALGSHERPDDGDLNLFPVLEAACDMDREFAHLVRLAVAVASQEALDREAPWVVAALEAGRTEVDDVVRRLQQQIRSVRLREALTSDLGPDSAPVGDQEREGQPDLVASVDGGTADQVVLTAALKVSITRCRDLLEHLDNLVAQAEAVSRGTSVNLTDDASTGDS